MICDKLTNYKNYYYGTSWEKIFNYLLRLDETSLEGKTELDGTKIFVGIDSYTTKNDDESVIESHKKYVDIQLLLSGKEMIKVVNTDSLQIDKDYDVDKDYMLHKKDIAFDAHLVLKPGMFCVFFPHDAHSPCLQVNNIPNKVKKVVVKVQYELLTGNRVSE